MQSFSNISTAMALRSSAIAAACNHRQTTYAQGYSKTTNICI